MRPRSRRQWEFNPAPRVVESGKVYKRAKAAQAARHEAQEEEVDMFNLNRWAHCSKAHAEAVSGSIRGPHVWISIGDPGEAPPAWKDNPERLGIHRLEVYDSLLRVPLLFRDQPPEYQTREPLTRAQAEEVYAFARGWILAQKGVRIFVHCHAGMARSATVAGLLGLPVHPDADTVRHIVTAWEGLYPVCDGQRPQEVK